VTERECRKIRLLLADDHPIVREGIKRCLPEHGPIEIVGEASDGEEAVAQAKKLAPDIVLLDISMPGMSGLEASKVLQNELPRTKVIILTIHDDAEYVKPVLSSGAAGYILKEASPAELARAVETVYRGDAYLSPRVSKVLLDQYSGRAKENDISVETLSSRELQVLRLISQGFSNKEIAGQMNISVRTVETHRERIMSKLNIRNVAKLTRFAIEQGL
jgi:two-component system nitrate/nitrite response regulator NarL